MSTLFETPYNIPSPEPFYAGSFTVFNFKMSNPFSEQAVDLTTCSDIIFSITLFGAYSNDIVVKLSKRNAKDDLKRILVDSDDHSVLIVKLYPDDTINFEDSWYDFQIRLMSIDGLENSTVGQGKVRVYKQI